MIHTWLASEITKTVCLRLNINALKGFARAKSIMSLTLTLSMKFLLSHPRGIFLTIIIIETIKTK